MEHDLWLASKVEESGKLFYFVRSKIDNDMQNDRRAHPRTHNAASKIAEIRQNLEKHLTTFRRKEIYLIDNYDTQAYDFGALARKMIEDSCGIKQDVLALSLACLSREVIEAKRKSLKRMIPLHAYFAAAFTQVVNLSLTSQNPNDYISHEIEYYGKEFGVDTSSLTKVAMVCDLGDDKKETVEELMSSHNKSMSNYLRQSIFHMINYIPLVGSISMFIRYSKHLKKCLDDTAERAIEVHCVLTENLAKKHVS
ncbi:T-cell-specific guanine nucleotide triphosphate-binding protein 2-like [Mercenaria mercenaria]|uniref:T-cell-specific guanine nucleotide triphosphate-binding protein 2-like n=1 Tax=Mercenaria mercenaria TaxID=6596 RepID=UPI00234EB218|nr:T-cell-specific guanine nucleotide triphosphate-binding protein 2-like [Mercenaria mercenaria]